MSGYDLPACNAVLNGTSAILLVAGFVAVRLRRLGLHKVLMLCAFACSGIFLASYLYYHFGVRGGEATRYTATGWQRTSYLLILLTHTVLAACVAFMAPTTIYIGLTNRLQKHRKLARLTFPIWLYVSVTGVLIYWILRDHYPTGPG